LASGQPSELTAATNKDQEPSFGGRIDCDVTFWEWLATITIFMVATTLVTNWNPSMIANATHSMGAVFQHCFPNAKRSLARIVSIWTTSCHKVANPKFARNVLKDRYVAEIAPPDGPVPMHANLEQGMTETPVEQHIPSNDNAVRDNAAQHIFAKTTAGRTIQVGITGDCDTVDDIKAVCKKAEILPARHRLVFAGKELKDGNLLADYNIRTGSTVRVVMPWLRGGGRDDDISVAVIANPILDEAEEALAKSLPEETKAELKKGLELTVWRRSDTNLHLQQSLAQARTMRNRPWTGSLVR